MRAPNGSLAPHLYEGHLPETVDESPNAISVGISIVDLVTVPQGLCEGIESNYTGHMNHLS